MNRSKWNSKEYLKFRPVYPDSLVSYIGSLKPADSTVWDCGTGNGQLAFLLSDHYKIIYASDISEVQINHAKQKQNIKYKVTTAENSGFEDAFFDLITIAQAIHWFDFDLFYSEVRRVSRTGALICICGYGNIETKDESMPIINHLYSETLNGYWDVQRKYIDESYKTIPFPFDELVVPEFEMKFEWSIDQLCGYLGTWSGLIKFSKETGENPIHEVYNKLTQLFSPDYKIKVRFPILLRVGKVN